MKTKIEKKIEKEPIVSKNNKFTLMQASRENVKRIKRIQIENDNLKSINDVLTLLLNNYEKT